MCLNNRFMFDLQHAPARDGTELTSHALPMIQAKRDQFLRGEVIGIRTTFELIKRVEERYGLPHEQTTL